MPYILAIEGSTTEASVHLCDADKPIVSVLLEQPNAASEKLHAAAKYATELAGISMKYLEAVAVSAGPGSYTGLRIAAGMAKGLCFALNLPLIAVSALEAIAAEAQQLLQWPHLICPMIDARRMEIYTALYDSLLNEIRPPDAVVYNDDFLLTELDNAPILFCGNGMPKLKHLLDKHANARFINILHPKARWIAHIGYQKFLNGLFEDVAHFEPLYLKLFDKKL